MRAVPTRDRWEPRLWLAFTTAVTVAAALAFWIPGARKAGSFPVPLDDVFIHFAFARSAALGSPFQWMPGNGYSSGGTSLLYPLLLAPGWLVGFRGERLALVAAFVAIVALVDAARSARALVRASSRLVAWLAPLVLLSVPLLDWSLFSGMEAALFVAVLGRALVSVRRAEAATPISRASAQLRAGGWLALLVATRPEALALALPLAVAVAHAGRSTSALRSLARALAPTFALLAVQALANRALTGEVAAAGAVRKLLTTNPYATPLSIAGEVLKNLAVLRLQVFVLALGGAFASSLTLGLGLVAALAPRTRRLGLSLGLGALGLLLLVSLNATARFQNFRYAAPSLAMLLFAALLGAAAIARRGGAGRVIAGLGLGAPMIAALALFPRQIDHFARASRNIAEQQVEVARRVKERAPRRVLVGDAGAIPYLSGVPAIDGLGLGGFRGLPFARASVHGVPAVVELLERLELSERPDLFALYPSWWRGLADELGRRVDAVKIEDNVICGADEKVIYEADLGSLAPPNERRAGAVDELDVADLVDEREHDLTLAAPGAGWVVGGLHRLAAGELRYDAGRILPEGRELGFTVRASVSRAPATLVLRTDVESEVVVEIAFNSRVIGAVVPPLAGDVWTEVAIALPEIGARDRVVVKSARGALRLHHAWLVRRP